MENLTEAIVCPRCKGIKHISGWHQEHVPAFIGGDIRDVLADVAFRDTCPLCKGLGTITIPVGQE